MPTLNKKGRELPRPRDKLNKQHPHPRHTNLPGVFLGWGLRGRMRERTHQQENRNMSSRPETSLMAPVWGRGPRERPESLLDGRDQVRGPSPKPRVSTTTARTSDLRADQGWLPAGCAAASHPGPRSLTDSATEAGVPTAPGEPTLTCGGRGSSETAHRQVEGQGGAGLRARNEGPAQPQPPSSVLTVPAVPGPTAASPLRSFSSPRI